jgi:hypothetical protein
VRGDRRARPRERGEHGLNEGVDLVRDIAYDGGRVAVVVIASWDRSSICPGAIGHLNSYVPIPHDVRATAGTRYHLVMKREGGYMALASDPGTEPSQCGSKVILEDGAVRNHVEEPGAHEGCMLRTVHALLNGRAATPDGSRTLQTGSVHLVVRRLAWCRGLFAVRWLVLVHPLRHNGEMGVDSLLTWRKQQPLSGR